MKMIKKIIAICLIICVLSVSNFTVIATQNASDIQIIFEKHFIKEGDYCFNGIIKAYKDDMLIWEHTTEDIYLQEAAMFYSDILVNSDNVYIVVNKVLYAFDIFSGTLKWTVENVGVTNSIDFDRYGNVYISGLYGPNLVVINKNGNVLYREEVKDSNYSWVENLAVSGNNLYIQYGTSENGAGMKKMSIKQFRPDEISVLLNAANLDFDQPPIVVNGRTLVPVRAVVEAMNGQVEWNDISQTVTLSCGSNKILLTIDSTTAYLNGNSVSLDVAPQIINGRTLLPIRFVAESFGYVVDWVEETKTVDIHNDETINYELLNCIGMSKVKICEKYGSVNNSEYYLGGKYYIHGNMKTQMFYENEDDVYNYEIHDDAPENAECLNIYAYLGELIKGTNKTSFSVNELAKVFGEYTLDNYLDDDMFPLCYYRFKYGIYNIVIESDHLNPIVEYVNVSR